MKKTDPVGDYLRKRGCPDPVIRGGLRGLTENWEEVVRSVEEGYRLGLDDYLNDLDVRQILEDALAIVPVNDRKPWLRRIRRADAKMRTLLRPAGRCLWGEETARQEGWTAKANWWYFSLPTRPGDALLSEVDGA